MSTLPLLMSLTNQDYWTSYFDDDFGFGIYPHQLSNLSRNRPRLALHALNRLSEAGRQAAALQKCAGEATSAVGKDGFQVCMDVQQFKPSELEVKTVDNTVIIEGKHEEREDEHGHICRHFIRRYELPKNYDPAQVVSALSSDGVLTIKVPPPTKSIQSNQRIIPIQHTGPAHLTVKENPKEENGEEKGVADKG